MRRTWTLLAAAAVTSVIAARVVEDAYFRGYVAATRDRLTWLTAVSSTDTPR